MVIRRLAIVAGCAAVALLGLLGWQSRPGLFSAESRPPHTTPVQSAALATPLPTLTSAPTATTVVLPTATATALPSATPTTTPTSPPPAASATPDDIGVMRALPLETPTRVPPPWPTPAAGGTYTVNVPILMYHYVSTPPPDADKYRRDLSVEPAQLRRQLQYLAENGFTTIDFYALARAIAGQDALPDKPVIITFDDGYVDNYVHAFPLLQEFGMTATFFIVTEFVDFGYAPYMTWEMLHEMAAAGMRLEPHSKTHVNLATADHAMQVYQILGSQETLAYHIGYTPRFFAYPSGFYSDEVIAVLRDLDFWGAVTTEYGVWHGFDNRYELGRVRMRYTTTLPELAAYLR